MAQVDRWRRWHPTMKKFEDAGKEELTKLTKGGFVSFVSSDSAYVSNFSSALDGPAPAAWAENFHRWMLERCTFQIRRFGGVEALYQDFCSWSKVHEELPAPRPIFDDLLAGAGLFQANGLVSGLILRAGCDVTRPISEQRVDSLKRGNDLQNTEGGAGKRQSRKEKAK